MKRTELKNVIIGEKVTDGVYCLKSVRKGNDGYNVVLSDRTGELNCDLAPERYSSQIDTLIGGPVVTSFVVINGVNTQPLGKIKSIEKAQEGTFSANDLFDGLSDVAVQKYIATIRECQKNIRSTECQNLVSKVLSDKALSQLAVLPASLANHGRYRGGALAATATVTKMAIQSGYQYLKSANGLYEPRLDWDLLITASLLSNVGVIDYYTHEPPFQMTSCGLERGYMSTLQRRIERIAYSEKGLISEFTLSRILNILSSSVPMKSGVKATSQEGILLRGSLILYEELDELDFEMATHEPEEGERYYFSTRLGKNIPIPINREEKIA